MQRWREWQTASDSDWGVASQREAVIRPLADQVRLTETDVTTAAHQLKLSRATLYRLIGRYRQRPQTSSLLPWKRGRDSCTQILDREREDLIKVCIQDFYLTPQRPSMAAFLRELRRRFAERALPPPHYRTVRRRLEALNARQTVTKREGAKAARAKFGPVKTSPLHSLLPLDLIQIDHTLVDVILVDQRYRLPIGRPWLTLGGRRCQQDGGWIPCFPRSTFGSRGLSGTDPRRVVQGTVARRPRASQYRLAGSGNPSRHPP